MKTFDLGRFRRARVWIGDLPDATYLSTNVTTHTITARSRSLVGKRLVAVELFVPLGARSMYGLIGGRFEPDDQDHLTVEVGTSSNSERLLTDSLASRVDEVHVGLPDEYVGAVLRGIDVARFKLGAITSGKLVIECGAHGMMGSCEAIYESLVVVLIELCNLASADISDSELIELFPREFR
jgi:hypothetical protein